MKSNVQTVLALFEPKRRYLVPMFQRQYVWSLERQWEPLWEDIERKVIERLRWNEKLQAASADEQAQIKANPPDEHFLGAIVLDHHPTFGNEVSAKLIIDGQQRLMTSQMFLAALRDSARIRGVEDYPSEVTGYVRNTGIMADREVEKYKVWPSRFDQQPFKGVIDACDIADLAQLYPGLKKGQAPRLVLAYVFFREKIDDFLTKEVVSDRLNIQPDAYQRAKCVFESLGEDLQIVTIELEGQDDPQIIFETLNARGEPLLPSDLLRNYLFWRASREHPQDVERLYADYWQPFDSEFWKKDERQGRLTRPRVDLFFYNLLQLKTGDEVNVSRLYHEYKSWSVAQFGLAHVSEELHEIHQYSLAFEKLSRPDRETAIGRFVQMLQIFDVRTANSLVLYLFADGNLCDTEFEGILVDLESYLVRRAICGMTTSNYNRLFVSWIPRLVKDTPSRNTLRQLMLAEDSDSGLWPDDARFNRSWLNDPLYPRLYSRGRMEYLLKRLESAARTTKHEHLAVDGKLTIEHVLPQDWFANWPLEDGTLGVRPQGRMATPSTASQARDEVLQTIGNLTLLTGPANSVNSNLCFKHKVPKMDEHSILVLNKYFRDRLAEGKSWNEEAMQERGRELFKQAVRIWPHPSGERND